MSRPRTVPVLLSAAGATGLLLAVAFAAGGAPAVSPARPAVDGGVSPAPLSPNVKIVFQTIPPEKAVVKWGKKAIGEIRGQRKPLIVERPRDSGPLDVVVRAEGYLPVHTRAYTFTDTKVYVKLTLVEDKKTLFGYREEVVLPDGGAPDGGLPAAAAGAPVGPPVMGPPGPASPPAPRDGGAL